ncbi:MAG: acyltransferase family protein [Prevotella sp.]|nr:acyltransferase family protein [Prevotella sp.]
MERKTYNSLDLMKIIASILVVAIHAEPLNGLSKDIVIDVFARVAVPFFFITSSFFFFKGYHDKQALLRYIRRLALLYMFWFVVTLPITVLNSFIEPDTSFAHNLLRFIRGFFLGSTFRGSWFLMALMECISFIWLLSRRLHTPTLLFIGICMYTISVLFSSYCFFLPWELQQLAEAYLQNLGHIDLSFISAFLPCTIGKWLAENLQRVTAISKSQAIGSTIILSVLAILEVLIHKGIHQPQAPDIYFLLLPLTVSVFVLMVVFETNMKLGDIRKMSIVFYFSHFIFVFIAVVVNKHIIPIHPFLKFFFVLACCYSLSKFIMKMKDTHAFRWLKYGI